MTKEIVIERSFLPKGDDWKKHTDWGSQRYIKSAFPYSLQTGNVIGQAIFTNNKGDFTYSLEYKLKLDDERKSKHRNDLTKDKFDFYLAESVDINLSKHRFDLKHFLSSDIKDAVVDIYIHIKCNANINQLSIIKFNFTSVEAANKFVCPFDLAEEITHKHAWSEYRMCLHHAPKEFIIS